MADGDLRDQISRIEADIFSAQCGYCNRYTPQ
jgi:hypothetical protein